MRALLTGVMALTLALVPAVAAAAEEEGAAPEVAPASEPVPAVAATPLVPRLSKPLTLASTSEGAPLGFKLFAGIGVVVAGGLWLRRKRRSRPSVPASRIDVIGRTSVGGRGELLVVEVEGSRLLVGMTPSAIQTLAVLDSAVDAPVEASEEAETSAASEAPERERRSSDREQERPMVQVADRARALLGGMRTTYKPPAGAPKRAAAAASAAAAAGARTAKIPRVAGQAKGLLLALEQPGGAEDDVRTVHRAAPERPVRLGDW